MAQFVTQSDTVFIALCFKNGPADVCDGSVAANAWLGLVDDLFTAAQAVAAEVNVQFVLDGESPAYDGLTTCRYLSFLSAFVPV